VLESSGHVENRSARYHPADCLVQLGVELDDKHVPASDDRRDVRLRPLGDMLRPAPLVDVTAKEVAALARPIWYADHKAGLIAATRRQEPVRWPLAYCDGNARQASFK
jgi:hypothetical protein